MRFIFPPILFIQSILQMEDKLEAVEVGLDSYILKNFKFITYFKNINLKMASNREITSTVKDLIINAVNRKNPYCIAV